MRHFKFGYLKILVAAAVLAFPTIATAQADDVPGSANWYFFVDFEEMRSKGPGQGIYNWLRDEVFDDIKEDSGLNIEKELDQIVAYATESDQGVIVAEGDFSQQTRDIVMTFIASGGDIDPQKTSGGTYYRFAGSDDIADEVSYEAGDLKVAIDALKEQSFISTSIKGKIIVTATENHMQELLANKGKLRGRGSHKNALLVMSANRALMQAGMRSEVLGEDKWDSNVLRNTKQAGFLIAAAGDQLSLQAKLTTIEEEMAESMASVVRGLISLASFDDDMDEETLAVIRGINVETKGNSLSISMDVDPGIVVKTLRE